MIYDKLGLVAIGGPYEVVEDYAGVVDQSINDSDLLVRNDSARCPAYAFEGGEVGLDKLDGDGAVNLMYPVDNWLVFPLRAGQQNENRRGASGEGICSRGAKAARGRASNQNLTRLSRNSGLRRIKPTSTTLDTLLESLDDTGTLRRGPKSIHDVDEERVSQWGLHETLCA